jgi:polynucleotide 5'-kinase involved in rRNA processing
MEWFFSLRDAIADTLFGPTAADAERQARANAQQIAPVVWLIGKTGSGKTSIVATLTNSDRAEVGNGFAPCTRSA